MRVRSRSKGLRVRLALAALATDLAAVVVADGFAVWMRNEWRSLGEASLPLTPYGWSLAVFAIAITVGSYANGLYELEVFVSRPLHLWRLVRVALGALLASSATLYLLQFGHVAQSRFVLLVTFSLFLIFSGAVRLGWLSHLFIHSTRERVAVLVGDSPEATVLGDRIGDLRAFNRLEVLASSGEGLDHADAVTRWLADHSASGGPMAAVVIDASGLGIRDVLATTRAAMHNGADVYVRSDLLEPLDASGLLCSLFDAPVVRVRRDLDSASPHALKRAFDVVGSAVLLLVAFPVATVVAALIKVTSPGPVFYAQTRVGRSCVPFRFLKFRSMVVNADTEQHAEYVKSFIAGEMEAMETPEGAFYKRVDDERITWIGRFIRKYSLDEIPQFWHVLKGDMSLVGPRPPLPYEVEHYDAWAKARLTAPPGVTGVWQVAGRSRVSFDEMVFQDIMYAKNMSLAVDVGVCLRTVPEVLLGRGAA